MNISLCVFPRFLLSDLDDVYKKYVVKLVLVCLHEAVPYSYSTGNRVLCKVYILLQFSISEVF
jgi:hypothetical protein